MPAKNPPTGTDADLNLATMNELFASEDKAREFLETRRWPNGPVCPHCQSTQIYKLTGKEGSKNPVSPGVYKCGKCREKFTVRIGTIYEDSRLPLNKWLIRTNRGICARSTGAAEARTLGIGRGGNATAAQQQARLAQHGGGWCGVVAREAG
jgi:transposase-like protein